MQDLSINSSTFFLPVFEFLGRRGYGILGRARWCKDSSGVPSSSPFAVKAVDLLFVRASGADYSFIAV